jgi:hypothetical protein
MYRMYVYPYVIFSVQIHWLKANPYGRLAEKIQSFTQKYFQKINIYNWASNFGRTVQRYSIGLP